MNKIRNEYPRPQFRREKWIALNGEWEFAFDDEKIGEKEGWQDGDKSLDKKILVPFTYQTEASGIGDESMHDVVWYRRKFTVENNGRERALLCFNGSDYITDVWVNGKHAITHKGGFAPFQADITDYLKNGENILVVRCFDTLDAFQPRGKQSWKEGKRFGCWYVPNTGIWQSVWIEFFDGDYIEDYSVYSDIDNQKVSGSVKVWYGVADEVSIAITSKEGKTMTKTFPVEQKHAVYELDIKELEEDVKLWTLEDPYLYSMDIQLLSGGKQVDMGHTRFGMRKISVDKQGKICLNDKPIYQRLVLDQGYWNGSSITPPSAESLKKDIELAKAMGFNGARKHEKLEDPYFYYYADELGFLTWCEMPSAYHFCDTSVKNVMSEWLEILNVAKNFTSVVTYVLLNESWGVDEIVSNKKQQNFANAMYYATKAIDDTRLISINDGWENLERSDFISIHDYAYDDSEFATKYIEGDLDVIAPVGRKQIVEGEKYQGQPKLLDEFGGVAMATSTEGENWGYGEGAADVEEFYKRVDNLVKGIRKCGFQGWCFTQLMDCEQEVNGLLDHNHNPKFDIERLREIFAEL